MPARLHRELVGNGDRRLLLTHGIFGSGANWRGIARKLVQRRPDWGVVLVDLRQHGRSEPGEPPHDLAACANDLRALVDDVPGIAAIAGHSFGGKVVLQARPLVDVQQIWMFDASPSARPGAADDPDNTVTRVLAVMERLPRTWTSRDDFIAAIVAAGQTPEIAQWLAMNVVPQDGQYVLRLDLAAMREMLADYYARDLWNLAFDPAARSESGPARSESGPLQAALPGELHVVIAERSHTLDDSDRARLASAPPHVHAHRIDSGHWLHIEAPANVVELLDRHLPTPLQ